MQRATSILLMGGPGSDGPRLHRALARRFALVENAADVATAQRLMARCRFDLLVMTDPGAAWPRLKSAFDGCQGLPDRVLMVVDRDRAEIAIEAIRDGVSDVLLRPYTIDELLASIRDLAGAGAPVRRPRQGRGHRALVGESPGLRRVRELIRRIAPAPTTVLIEGETGTGKELVARLLHDKSHRTGHFVPVNCGAIAPDLLESELFGHTRGAFTSAHGAREGLFVAAGGGTLFLDEISEMRLDMEVKLLRALEENAIRPVGSDREVSVDCRIVASTQERLETLVEQQRFREDLYYRLNVIRIELPALRERPEDIPALAAHFMDHISAGMGMPPLDLTPTLIEQLQCHHWPGNIRELRNVVERTLLMGRLPGDLQRGPVRPAASPDYPLDWTLEQVKHHHMHRVLAATDGNKSAAARRLDISRKTLERKLGTTRPERKH